MKFSKLKIVFVFCLLNQYSIYAQEKLDVLIKDNFGKPLPYASVIWGKSIGLVTDTAGYLQIPDKSKIDSLMITAIGFAGKTIKKGAVLNQSKIDIVLQQTVIELPGVIAAKYLVEKELGSTNTKKMNSYFRNNVCNNTQCALLIKSYSYPAQCISISVFIDGFSSTNVPYRLRLYQIGNDSLPGKDLLVENLIVNNYKANAWNTYNLDSIPVQLPKDGFFVAIECLCTDLKSVYGLCIAQTSKIEEALTYYKYGNVGWFQPNYKGGPDKFNIMLKAKVVSVK